MHSMTADAPLSPDENDICECVVMNQLNLRIFGEGLAVAVQLFELLERGGGPPQVGVFGGVFNNYRMIAAKEGALNIYHFGCSLRELRQKVGLCPRTRDKTAGKKLREADKLFRQHFPNAEAIRHAIAHAGEVWTSPHRAARHQLKQDHSGPDGSHISAGAHQAQMLSGRTYSVQWEGSMFQVTMDGGPLHALSVIQALVDAALP